jgi:hypothetical protein
VQGSQKHGVNTYVVRWSHVLIRNQQVATSKIGYMMRMSSEGCLEGWRWGWGLSFALWSLMANGLLLQLHTRLYWWLPLSVNENIQVMPINATIRQNLCSSP